ncbi:MAG TPA: protein kinase [Chloroflexota bacterium]|jgi:serine/threonine-protein kinase|nr:protein kinase [Chloroflexota bacterium]
MTAAACAFPACPALGLAVDDPDLTLCPTCRRPLAGATIGGRPGFRLTGLLGSGYYADVFRAIDLRSGRACAAKGYRPGHARRRAAAREAGALRQLVHHRIPALIDSFVEDGWRFVVMDLIDGPSLRAEVEGLGPLAVDRAIRLGAELCEALEHVASRGWVFRDLHPKNVHLDPARGATLLDFDGARRANSRGAPGGRIGYRSPEVENRLRLTAAADVYGLAGCLHFALTGEDPPAEAGALRIPPAARASRPALFDLLDQCRAPEPGRRPTAGFLGARFCLISTRPSAG